MDRTRAMEKSEPRPKNPKKAQMCKDCGKEVLNMRLHTKRLHLLKYTGYDCPDCLFQTSEMDPRMFRNHRARTHGVRRMEDIERFTIEVPEGYYGMHKCGNCQFFALTQDKIDAHPCQPENEIYDYVAGNQRIGSKTAGKM